jgi:hypothetical protein
MVRSRIQRATPYLAALAATLGVVLFLLSIVYTFHRQSAVDEKLCRQTVANRAATRGIWEGARRLSLGGVTDEAQRAQLDAFFAEILRPYPALSCHGSEPKPAALEELELVSYTTTAVFGLCVPFIPATCPPPPSSPPANPPPASDDPPQMVSLFVDGRTRRTVKLGWETAIDEEGIAAYRIYRDSTKRATAGPRARRSWVFLPCGVHVYAVEAVDTSGQRDAMALAVRRRC